jgi:hypothetical protein
VHEGKGESGQFKNPAQKRKEERVKSNVEHRNGFYYYYYYYFI